MSAAEVTDTETTPESLMLDDLARSGLTAKDAERAGYVAETFRGQDRYPIPYFDLDGEPFLHEGEPFVRWRNLGDLPLDKDGKPMRYGQPGGIATPVYLPPLKGLGLGYLHKGKWRPIRSWRQVANNPTIEIYITEGEKKAYAACKAGFPTISVGGVDNWAEGRKKAGDRDHLVKGLRDFKLDARTLAIIYDSDAATKDGVQRAEREQATALQRRGAHARIIRLPPKKDGTPQGLDDFLKDEGADELRKLDAAAGGKLPDALRGGDYFLTEENFPPLAYAIAPYLPKKEYCEINGAHGHLKSALMLHAALCVATGEPFHTNVPVKRGESIFISLEDNGATLHRRITRWLRGEDSLFVKVAKGKHRSKEKIEALKEGIRRNFRGLGMEDAAELGLTKQEFGQTAIRTDNVNYLIDRCQGADLIVLETASLLHDGPEDNAPLAVFARALKKIVNGTGACVVTVRHIPKEEARQLLKGSNPDSYLGRGGGSLADGTRSIMTALRKEEKTYGKVLRLTHTRSSHTAAPGPELWWRIDEGLYLAPIDAPAKAPTMKAEKEDVAARLEDAIRSAGTKGATGRYLKEKFHDRNVTRPEIEAALGKLVKDKRITATTGRTKSSVTYRMASMATGGAA